MTSTHTPWPEMPSHLDTEVAASARLTSVRGQRMLLLPFTAPIGRSRGRRFRISLDGRRARTAVVLAVGGQAAVKAPAELGSHDRTVPVRITALAPRRRRRVPADLEQALARAGASLENLTEAQVEQLLLMVTESSSGQIRAQRVTAAVQAALAAGDRHG